MKFEKIKPRGNQEMEKIHIEAPCELFVLCDPNHRPIIKVVRSTGAGTETTAEKTGTAETGTGTAGKTKAAPTGTTKIRAGAGRETKKAAGRTTVKAVRSRRSHGSPSNRREGVSRFPKL